MKKKKKKRGDVSVFSHSHTLTCSNCFLVRVLGSRISESTSMDGIVSGLTVWWLSIVYEQTLQRHQVRERK